jgi:hypothetical protein
MLNALTNSRFFSMLLHSALPLGVGINLGQPRLCVICRFSSFPFGNLAVRLRAAGHLRSTRLLQLNADIVTH